MILINPKKIKTLSLSKDWSILLFTIKFALNFYYLLNKEIIVITNVESLLLLASVRILIKFTDPRTAKF